MRFESLTGRVTVTLVKNVRVFGGYGQDRNNRDDQRLGPDHVRRLRLERPEARAST